jgi:hypothetical protein
LESNREIPASPSTTQKWINRKRPRHGNEGRKMIQKPFNQISKADIESLVSAKVSESRKLDYKQQLPDNDTEKKREFLYDVSSFVNAAGGDHGVWYHG